MNLYSQTWAAATPWVTASSSNDTAESHPQFIADEVLHRLEQMDNTGLLAVARLGFYVNTFCHYKQGKIWMSYSYSTTLNTLSFYIFTIVICYYQGKNRESFKLELIFKTTRTHV